MNYCQPMGGLLGNFWHAFLFALELLLINECCVHLALSWECFASYLMSNADEESLLVYYVMCYSMVSHDYNPQKDSPDFYRVFDGTGDSTMTQGGVTLCTPGAARCVPSGNVPRG